MNKNKIRVMAYLISCSMFLSACGKNFKLVDFKNPDDLITSATDSKNEEGQEQTEVFETEDITEPTIEPAEPTIDSTEPTIEPTEPTIEPTEPTIKEPDAQNAGLIVYATTDVNMRSSNTTESLKIGKLKVNDSAVKILSCENNWDLVKYNGEIGYVCRDYLQYSNEEQNDGYDHVLLKDIVLTTSNLNFRSEPTTKSEKISSFNENTELQVIAKVDNGWLLVKHNGVLGYVHADYTESLLRKANEQYPELNLKELDVKKVVYTTANLNVRNGNNTDCDKIGSLEEYESVRVLKEDDDWYFVLTNDYNFGFINKSYTKDLNDIFVVVDIGEQKLFMYNDDELYFVTPVTTGKDSTPSDIGLYKIYSKERDRYLVGADYKSFVNYWMPYNRGEGLHDASWRNVFGTDSYKTNGSHGCINMPPSIADDIYENASVGTKVLVHK